MQAKPGCDRGRWPRALPSAPPAAHTAAAPFLGGARIRSTRAEGRPWYAHRAGQLHQRTPDAMRVLRRRAANLAECLTHAAHLQGQPLVDSRPDTYTDSQVARCPGRCRRPAVRQWTGERKLQREPGGSGRGDRSHREPVAQSVAGLAVCRVPATQRWIDVLRPAGGGATHATATRSTRISCYRTDVEPPDTVAARPPSHYDARIGPLLTRTVPAMPGATATRGAPLEPQ